MLNSIELKKLYQSDSFHRDFTYHKNDLGVLCSQSGTAFTLWAPLAQTVTLVLYQDGDTSPAFASIAMTREPRGIWRYRTKESLHCIYYEYHIDHGNQHLTVAGDPYACACGYNSKRCMVVDLSKTNPDGWLTDKAPAAPPEDIIYELHIKEFSWQEDGGFPKEMRGKYKAFTCTGTTLHDDKLHPTGLDYLKELGVTHVQLMPVYDYGSVDDDSPSDFNWGYDPVYYNIPEGSYSSDPHHGEVRIKEFKEMIQSLHRRGFRVIMDVVYNHTYHQDSVFDRTAPWYYYRSNEQGIASNGSACGCDVASERPMCAKFILDSVLYWAEEYHIDGFRFDLMGLLDIDLMNRTRRELDARYGKGEKLVFGEPWAAASTDMEHGAIPALKANISLLDENVGMFCDDTRDAIKGHVFELEAPGFVTGAFGTEQAILDSAKAWCSDSTSIKAPSQIITHVSAHDNWTLWDKLGALFPDPAQRLQRNKLAAAIYMTCQGRLFFLSGEEFGRTKNGLDNTYKESIALNRLDWERAYAFSDLRSYYKGLISLRKRCPGLCDKASTAKNRFFGMWKKPGAVGYYLNNLGTFDTAWSTLCIIFNASSAPIEHTLLPGRWQVLVDAKSSEISKKERQGTIQIPSFSALILGKPT